MKKILSVLLVLIMVVALVACNSSKQDETTKEDVTTETTTQKETEQTTTVETTTDETTEETTEQTTEETTTDKTEPEKKSIKIFAIGNSFSEDSVEHLYGILKDLGYEEIVIGNMYTGGCSLAQHAKNIEHREKGFYTTYYENTNGKWVSNPVQPTLVNTINRHDWDYISIQQVSGDSGRPETFEPYLTTVLNYIKEHCPDAEIMWNMTWAYPSDKTYSSFKNYDNDQMKMYNAILEATKKERAHLGCMFTSPAGQLVKGGNVTGGETLMTENNAQDLITVILNSGYADDAMDAARKAGAGGGTVIKARGTAKPDDPQFFGMHIVPEKETLLIVVPHEKKDSVLDAIKNLDCLSQPGSGIAYCSPVNEFVLLGKK